MPRSLHCGLIEDTDQTKEALDRHNRTIGNQPLIEHACIFVARQRVTEWATKRKMNKHEDKEEKVKG